MRTAYFSKLQSLSFLFCLLLATRSSADSVFLSKEKLVGSYIDRTSLRIGGLLTRPVTSSPTNINIICVAQQPCRNAKEAIEKFVKASWLSPVEATVKDVNLHLVTLVLFSDGKVGAKELDRQLELTFSDQQKVFGEGEEECKAYGTIDGLEVTRIVIFANVNIGDKRMVSCVLSTLARSSGLGFFSSYIDQWKIGGELSGASEEVFAATMKGTARLLAIHFSSFTRPGMTIEQFIAETSRLNLRDLIGEQ